MSEDRSVHQMFSDPECVTRYAEGPGRLVPGFGTLHRMVLQLLGERLETTARLLVLGAGGGLELLSFARARPGWTFVGVDPSRPMLEQARQVLGELANRVEFMEGTIPNAPAGPFDAATCLLTLHFVPDDRPKLEALRAIRERLAPGAPFAIVDHCIDKAAPDAEQKLQRFAQFAVDSGFDAARVDEMKARLKSTLHSVSPSREEALLAEAGFTGTELFFAGLSWRGWMTYA